MRLIFDLFACQTDSRLRGIGRYTLSLAQAMAAQHGEHELRLLANALYPLHADTLRCAFTTLAPGAFATYSHPPVAPGGPHGVDEQVASALVHLAYDAVGADVVLCGSPFEGWGEAGMVAQPRHGGAGALQVAILYDIIPLLFPDQHLAPVPDYERWYRRRLAGLQQADLLLAISEATRRDAIELLGLDPARVVNISGAADSLFQPLTASALAAIDLSAFAIKRPFVLYTGNGDYRKNLVGMLEAYAMLPAALRRQHQLVLNQVGERASFRAHLRRFGLGDDEVVVTGHISDAQLCALYNRCKVFVFPSLYEGFGLPLLEAMACGAPVLAANNSSIPEVTGRADLLFDGAVPAAIAAKLERALVDDDWRAALASYGPGRAASFSWQRSAALAWAAIEGALVQRHAAAAPLAPRRRLALVMAFDSSAASARGAALATALAGHAELRMYGEAAALPAGVTHAGGRDKLAEQVLDHDCVLYLASAGAIDSALTATIRQAPGVLLLDGDAATSGPAHDAPPVTDDGASQVLRDHGLQGLVGLHLAPPRPPRPKLLAPSVLEATRHLLLTPAAAATLRAGLAAGALPPLSLLDSNADRAPQVLAAVEQAIARDPRRAATQMRQAWGSSAPAAEQVAAACLHAERNLMLNRGARLLIDVTQLAKTDALSGIQRVVRNISRELCLLGQGAPIELVRLHEGVLVRASAVARAVSGLQLSPCPAEPVDIQPGDTLLMIDSSWEQYPDFAATFDAVRLFGGRIVTVVYDLIPLRLPHYCSAGLVLVFETWFRLAVAHSDMLLCISQAVRDDVAAYLREHKLAPPRPLRLDFWQLGADILPAASDQTIRPEVAALAAARDWPLFLMVGTVEPRKGHEAVLDAFDALWASGSHARLCLAGKEGWHVEALMQRIRSHPELGRRLLFIERFSDAEINLCYANAHALVVASVAEGYGLPIVEAASHGVPVIASDIAVFREVAGDGAEYFPLGDKEALMALIERFAGYDAARRRALAARVKLVSWRDSAAQLASRLRSCFAAPRDDAILVGRRFDKK